MKLIVDILGKFKKKTYPIAWYVFPAIFKTFIGQICMNMSVTAVFHQMLNTLVLLQGAF